MGCASSLQHAGSAWSANLHSLKTGFRAAFATQQRQVSFDSDDDEDTPRSGLSVDLSAKSPGRDNAGTPEAADQGGRFWWLTPREGTAYSFYSERVGTGVRPGTAGRPGTSVAEVESEVCPQQKGRKQRERPTQTDQHAYTLCVQHTCTLARLHACTLAHARRNSCRFQPCGKTTERWCSSPRSWRKILTTFCVTKSCADTVLRVHRRAPGACFGLNPRKKSDHPRPILKQQDARPSCRQQRHQTTTTATTMSKPIRCETANYGALHHVFFQHLHTQSRSPSVRANCAGLHVPLHDPETLPPCSTKSPLPTPMPEITLTTSADGRHSVPPASSSAVAGPAKTGAIAEGSAGLAVELRAGEGARACEANGFRRHERRPTLVPDPAPFSS